MSAISLAVLASRRCSDFYMISPNASAKVSPDVSALRCCETSQNVLCGVGGGRDRALWQQRRMSSDEPDTSTAAAPIFVAASSDLPEGARLHLTLGDECRNVSVVRHNGKLHCFDSVCYHAGGPLGSGDIEDVDGTTCILCPWHNYKVTIDTGEKLYRGTEMVDGKIKPIGWMSAGVKQRVHKIDEGSDGNIYVTLGSEGVVASDKYGCRERDQGRGDMRSSHHLMSY